MFPGSSTVYKLMYLVGFALMMVINLKTQKKYKLKTHITVIITLITYVAGVVGAMIMSNVDAKIMSSNGFNVAPSVAIFGAVIFTPIFMTIVSLILRQDWRRVIDMLAPGIFVILACAKLGCFLHGCCHGIECTPGIKYRNIDFTVFPIQIIEVFLMCLIIAFCFWYALKSERYVKGGVYPATTILYCFMRFFVEFFRYYEFEAQRHMVFGMTLWQFCCIMCILVSIVWLIVIHTNKVKELDRLCLEKEAEAEMQAEKQAKLDKMKKRKEKVRRKK